MGRSERVRVPAMGARGVAVSARGLKLPEAGLTANLRVSRGEAAIIQGPAGSGKTLLLEVLRFQRAPRGGEVTVLGAQHAALRPQDCAAMRRRIGAITQPPRFLEHLSAAMNVAAPLRLAGRLAQDYSKDVDEALEFFGLAPADERPVSALSETARRRVAAARAIVAGPELILADEPTAGLAPEGAARLLRTLVNMRATGAAVIIATQQPDLAAALDAAQWRIQDGELAPVKQEAQ